MAGVTEGELGEAMINSGDVFVLKITESSEGEQID